MNLEVEWVLICCVPCVDGGWMGEARCHGQIPLDSVLVQKWRLVFDLIFNRPTKGQSMHSSDPIWDGRCHLRLPTGVLLSMHCELPDISAVVPPIRWTEILEDVYFSFCG
jgi:hypothetical protein